MPSRSEGEAIEDLVEAAIDDDLKDMMRAAERLRSALAAPDASLEAIRAERIDAYLTYLESREPR